MSAIAEKGRWPAERPADAIGSLDASTPTVRLHNVSKLYHTEAGATKLALDSIGFEIKRGEKIAVLGKNGAGKSTLVKIIGGGERPTHGLVIRGMSLSWPLTLGAGGFEQRMSGLDNIRFIARIYDRPIAETIATVDDFAELGRYLREPVVTYSSGMQMRLAFALTLAVEFECYLIDEVISVGDQRFAKKCHEELFVRRGHCSMILVSHAADIIRSYCNKALVMKNGRGRVFDDVERALAIYATL